jgi:2-phosphosulfolactate phosphatase
MQEAPSGASCVLKQMYYFDNRATAFCEWGEQGIDALRDHVDVFVIVDVLSFSTCVDIAVSRGAKIHPYPYKDESAKDFARSIGALCASTHRSKTELSLSSRSLLNIESGMRLVLPSPNGSHLSRLTEGTTTLCGSLRNAIAVADAAEQLGERIAVIAAGERWQDGSVRFAIEDLIGAGAIISQLKGDRTAEAQAAVNAFTSCKHDLHQVLNSCTSGIELIERGFPEDVELAAQLNVSNTAPRLLDGGYRSA